MVVRFPGGWKFSVLTERDVTAICQCPVSWIWINMTWNPFFLKRIIKVPMSWKCICGLEFWTISWFRVWQWIVSSTVFCDPVKWWFLWDIVAAKVPSSMCTAFIILMSTTQHNCINHLFWVDFVGIPHYAICQKWYQFFNFCLSSCFWCLCCVCFFCFFLKK